MIGRFPGLLVAMVLLAVQCAAQLNRGTPKEIDGIDEVKQNLGAMLPLDARFVDDLGRDVTLRDYFKGDKPVLITLNYFACASLCSYQLTGLLDALKEMTWVPGNEFDIVTISFDPLEGRKLAADKKEVYINEYGVGAAAKGWHFLTGKKDAIRSVTSTVGFPYRWNEERQEYAHPACAVVCSPDGRIMRYFGSIAFDPAVLRLSLVEASEGKIGSIWDQVFLICFHYVSSEGRYTPAVMGIMKVSAGTFAVLVGILLTVLWRMEVRRRRGAGTSPGGGITAAGPA